MIRRNVVLNGFRNSKFLVVILVFGFWIIFVYKVIRYLVGLKIGFKFVV